MAAVRLATEARALAALQAVSKEREGRAGITRRQLMTTGRGGYFQYRGAGSHGLAWTSGVWLFVGESSSPERLDRLLEASRAGGQGGPSPVFRYSGWMVALTFALGLTGTHLMVNAVARWVGVPPRPGVAPVPRWELRARLLALDDPGRPFSVAEDPKSDLVVEWKLVDATWWGIFHKAGLSEAYRMRLLLDERRREVRALTFFRGIVLYRYERGRAWGVRSVAPPEAGVVYDYRFDLRDIKGPVMATVTEAGWRFSPVLWPWQVRRRV